MSYRSVFISAGHATSPRIAGTQVNGFKEEELTLELRDLIAVELRALGIPYSMDGATGVSRPLPEAIRTAAAHDISVEVHFNSGAANETGGFGMSAPSRKRFATELGVAVSKAMGLRPNQGTGFRSDTTTRFGSLGFCRQGRGVVLEVCQQSTMSDMRAYLANKVRVAKAIAMVIKAWASRVGSLYDGSDGAVVRPKKSTRTNAARKRNGRRRIRRTTRTTRSTRTQR